ncbi:alpha-mannosidase [candidate division KSB1 bacterium]|nr:alpha-mannosidase [candidate division KSB1 bacterium]
MKRWAFILMMLFVSFTAAQSQDVIDQVVNELHEAINTNFDTWKYSEIMNQEAYRNDFNDRDWSDMSLGERSQADSAWFRKIVTLPQSILGRRLKRGGKITLQLTVDDGGTCWINGEKKGTFNWTGEFLLTENAVPGADYTVVIKAFNTGGPLRLINASLNWDAVQPYREEIENFTLSLRVGKKLLSDDTYLQVGSTKRDDGIDLSKTPREKRIALRDVLDKAAREVRLDALHRNDVEIFEASLDRARKIYQPVADYAKEFTLVLDSNAHIDCAWLWRYLETINIAKNTFESVLNMMDARPDFTYTQSQAHLFWWIETMFPELNERIHQRVKDGRFELVGGMWVEPDCNLISGESWVRQLLYGKRYFYEKFGVDIKIGWNPDSFGYNWNMPQIYSDAGIKAFITQKIGWNDTNMFPYRLFWWQGPDSSRILTYFPYNYVNDMKNPYGYSDWMRQFEANTGFKKMLLLYGVGDHGGGPTPEMLDQVNYLREIDIYPQLEYGTATAYLDWLAEYDLSQLPVWQDELYLEYHRGTYTTQSDTKYHNRLSEVKFNNAEQLSSIASIYGYPYPYQNFLDGWQHILFNQFHDVLPGSSIYPVYKDADRQYEEVFHIADEESERAFDYIIKNIDTRSKSANATPVVVYNTLPWTRTDIVELKIDKGTAQNFLVFDSQGNEVTSQTVTSHRYHDVILFMAKDVPSMGYEVYELRPSAKTRYESTLKTTATEIENQFFKIAIDPSSGWIRSIYDIRNKTEILAGAGNELKLFDDRPSAWDAWNIGLGERFPSTFRGIQIVESGPVRSVVRVEHDFLKPGVIKSYPTPNNPNSYFKQDIILYDGIDRIDFVTHADWWEDHVMLKVAFNVAVSDSLATYEIPFGSIKRPTTMNNDWEKARFEVSQQKWSDLTNPEHDLGVSLLNRAKYGGDIHDSVMRLSLLRSPKWPDPMADMGEHHLEYSLYPHSKCWKCGRTMQHAFEYNYPLMAKATSSHQGKWTKTKSFFAVDKPNIVLNTIKAGEPEQTFKDESTVQQTTLILRLYEAYGRETVATITLPENVQKAVVSNLLEEEIDELAFEKNQIRLTFEPYKIKTIKVWFNQ